MTVVNINYAYDGFLYAPLFLAEHLGILQTRMRLRFRNGDEATIKSLVQDEPGAKNWFAVCDPFAKDITLVQKAIGTKDEVCIIGAFIHRLPIWLYAGLTPRLDICGNEDDLQRARRYIERVRCYRQFNTGYLIGKRVQSSLDIAPDKLDQIDFGKDFDQLGPNTAVVTSDVLGLVSRGSFSDNSVIFSYAKRVPELNPFLFTGILTLKSVIDNNLDAVLTVLNGFRSAAHSLLEPASLQALTSHFTGFSTAQIQDAITILAEEGIYASDFDLDEAAKAYNNAKHAWESLKPTTKFADIEKCRDPIPCLLLRNSWHSDQMLVDLLADRWRDDPQLVEIVKKKLPSVPLPAKHYQTKRVLISSGLLALLLISGLSASYGWNNRGPHGGPFIVLSFVFAAMQLGCSFSLFRDLANGGEMKRFELLFGTSIALVIAVVGVVLAVAVVQWE